MAWKKCLQLICGVYGGFVDFILEVLTLKSVKNDTKLVMALKSIKNVSKSMQLFLNCLFLLRK